MRVLSLCFALGALACAAPSPSNLTADQRRERIETMYATYAREFPGVQAITVEELVALRANGDVVVVDVREPEERRVSMIPGAIAKETFEAEREAYADRTVVAYCTIGYRSGLYTRELIEDGVDARNLAGSILSWVDRGHPLVNASGEETKRVHTYGERWAMVPEDYEAVY